MQKLSIDLSNYFINKKIFWIFKDSLIPNKNFMNFCLSFAREDNYINIIILKKDDESKKIKVLKAVMKTFGKKIIIVTNKNKKNKDDESVFFCKRGGGAWRAGLSTICPYEFLSCLTMMTRIPKNLYDF